MKFLLLALMMMLTWKCDNALVVNCKFSYYNYKVGNLCECIVQNKEDFIGDNVSLSGATGTHRDGETNTNVQAFDLPDAENVTKMPTNINKIFPSLICIFIRNSGIKELTQDDFAPLPNLKEFRIYYSPIKIIHKNTFKGNSNLEVIILYSNHITHIDRMTFSHLTKLRMLDLRNNKPCPSLSDAETRSEVEDLITKIENGICESLEHTKTTTTSTTTQNPVIPQLTPPENNLEKQPKEANEKIRQITVEKKQTEKNLEEKIAELKKQIEELKKEASKVKSCEEKLEEEKIKVSNLTTENEVMVAKILQLSAKNDELKTQNYKLSAENQKLQEENQLIKSFDVKTAITKLTNEFIQSQRKCETKLEESVKKNEESTKNIEETTKMVKESTKKINDLHENCSGLLTTAKSHEEELRKAHDERRKCVEERNVFESAYKKSFAECGK